MSNDHPPGAQHVAEVRVLGPVEVVTVRGPVRLSRLQRCLVAVLAAHLDQVVPSERLVDALWGGVPPGSARNRVQALVSGVRRITADHFVVTSASGYRLHLEPDRLDAVRFTRLADRARTMIDDRPAEAVELMRDALALWRGAAYEDAGTAALTGVVAHLDELRCTAVEDLAELRLSRGEYGAVVAELTGLVAEHPIRDRLRGLLMLALHRSGRQADALAVYRHGAAALADEYGLDPSEDLRRLRDAILLNETPARGRLAWPEPAPHVAGGSRATINQLPSATADFVGRGKQVKELRALLAEEPTVPGASTIMSIAGMAGVGKTALAVRVAHELRSQLAVPCLFADLHGSAESPPGPHAVLGSFLRAYGVSAEAVPEDLDGRAALYRSVLDGTRPLVVLDNAADEGQVRPLVPGAGARVLVTSRRPLTGLDGVRVYPLAAMPLMEGLELLARIAGHGQPIGPAPELEQVVALCGGLPLALRVAGVRLAQREPTTAAVLVRRLLDERHRLDELAVGDLDVRASVEVSYHQLRTGDARLLMLLCTVPFETFAPWLAATLVDEPLAEVRLRLDRLVAAQLVDTGPDDRFRLHDLVRLHGRDRARAAVPQAARAAAAQRALRTLAAWAGSVGNKLPCRPIPLPVGSPEVADVPHPTAWFEAELGNVASAVGYAVDCGLSDLAGQLAVALANFCLLRGYLDDWEQGLRRVRTLAEPAVQLSYATLLRSRDRSREALPPARLAYRLYRRSGDRLGAATAALALSITARTLGRYRVSDTALAVAGRLLDEAGAPAVQSGYLHLTGYHASGKTAPDRLHAALRAFAAAGERWGTAEAQNLLSTAREHAGDLDDALALALAAAATYEELGDPVNRLQCDLQAARIHLAAQRPDRARLLLRSGLRQARVMQHRWSEATALRLLGQLHLAEGRDRDARVELEQSVEVFQEIEQPLPAALSMFQLARAILAGGDRESAGRTARAAHPILTRLRPAAAVEVDAWLSDLDTPGG